MRLEALTEELFRHDLAIFFDCGYERVRRWWWELADVIERKGERFRAVEVGFEKDKAKLKADWLARMAPDFLEIKKRDGVFAAFRRRKEDIQHWPVPYYSQETVGEVYNRIVDYWTEVVHNQHCATFICPWLTFDLATLVFPRPQMLACRFLFLEQEICRG